MRQISHDSRPYQEINTFEFNKLFGNIFANAYVKNMHLWYIELVKKIIAHGLLEAWKKNVFSSSNYDSIHMSEFKLNLAHSSLARSSAHCVSHFQLFTIFFCAHHERIKLVVRRILNYFLASGLCDGHGTKSTKIYGIYAAYNTNELTQLDKSFVLI